jgi:hypothetical protein
VGSLSINKTHHWPPEGSLAPPHQPPRQSSFHLKEKTKKYEIEEAKTLIVCVVVFVCFCLCLQVTVNVTTGERKKGRD